MHFDPGAPGLSAGPRLRHSRASNFWAINVSVVFGGGSLVSLIAKRYYIVSDYA